MTACEQDTAHADPLLEFMQWRQAHPDRGVPENEVTVTGFALGRWVRRVRAAYTDGHLSSERIAELEAVGFTWTGQEDRERGRRARSDRRFAEMLDELRLYRDTVGDVLVPSQYVAPSGQALGSWTSRMQRLWRRDELSPTRRRKLYALGLRATRDETYTAAITAMTRKRIGL